MPRKRKRGKNERGSLLWIYLIISVLAPILSLLFSCTVTFLLNEAGIIDPFNRHGEGLFFFCIGPIIIAIPLGLISALVARRFRGKLSRADEYIDAGVSSLTEVDEDSEENETCPDDEPGAKTLTE